MAIIKAINRNGSLSRIIGYITQNDKTYPELMGGFNVDASRALEEMKATKKQWNKIGGRLYKHFVQSFEIGSVTSELANQIAWEFVQRVPMFRDYEVLFATHTDRNHIHTHFVVNSVSFRNGRKLRYAASVLDEMKKISDQILREHGLQIEDPDRITENVTSWDQDVYQVLRKAHEGKMGSWVYDAAVAVLKAMEISPDGSFFTTTMEQAGYRVQWGLRNVMFGTPDSHRISAARLEEIFKIPSVLERYGDRQALYQTLKNDLLNTRRIDSETKGKFYCWQKFDNTTCSDRDMHSETRLRISVQKMESAEEQQEIDAAAYIYGCALSQDPAHVAEILARHGYVWREETQTIITPKGNEFDVLSGIPAKTEGVFTFQKDGDLIHTSYEEHGKKTDGDIPQTSAQLAESIAGEGTLMEFLSQIAKISQEAEIFWKKPGRSRVRLQDGWHYLDNVLKTGRLPSIDTLFSSQHHPPILSEELSAEISDEKASAIATYQPVDTTTAQMQRLLQSLEKAVSQADTKDAFADAMKQYGYTLRWTQNGTLTFIDESGERIRASRLEKKYRLPPIAAAYGSISTAPSKGERPRVAEAVRDALARSSTPYDMAVIMQKHGYELHWKPDQKDAVIITKEGQHIRLNNLIRQYGLPEIGDICGIQHNKALPGRTEREDLGSLREAVRRAEASLHRGRAGLSDRPADRTDPNLERGERSSQAETAVRQRAYRDAGRKRCRNAAKQRKQCQSAKNSPGRE